MENLDEAFESLMKDASKAAEKIREKAVKGGFINLISHLDADGLAAAGILGKALARLDAYFRIRIRHWVDEKLINEIISEKPDLTIFTDLGSGYLDLISEGLSEHEIVILDHHQPVGEPSPSHLHVNPHQYGVDGSIALSGAGVAYLTAKAIDSANQDLAYVAVVGALGDMQDKYGQRSLGGLNEYIVKDAVETGFLEVVEKEIIFFGRETRPIHKALACTTSPFIPGLSGEEDKCLAFLASIGIKPKIGDKWRALRDLTEEEKTKLCSSLAEYLISKGVPKETLNLVGTVYTFVREEPWTPLRDGREFSVLLNATGRMEKPSLGIAICMGDRSLAFEEATKILEEYRRLITKHLGWLIENERIKELDHIYVVQGENDVEEKIIGTIASILSTNMQTDKPIIAYAIVPEEEIVKVSARTIDSLVKKGLDLSEIMREAAEKCEGRGGGHKIAAGAQIPIKQIENFIKIVDRLVAKQLGK